MTPIYREAFQGGIYHVARREPFWSTLVKRDMLRRSRRAHNYGWGRRADFVRASPVSRALGKSYVLGPVGASPTDKLVGHVVVAITIGAVADGLSLAERNGPDSATLLHPRRWICRKPDLLRVRRTNLRLEFSAGAANRIYLKDLMAIESLATDTSISLPLTRQTPQAVS